jgi:hypothetical protein
LAACGGGNRFRLLLLLLRLPRPVLLLPHPTLLLPRPVLLPLLRPQLTARRLQPRESNSPLRALAQRWVPAARAAQGQRWARL